MKNFWFVFSIFLLSLSVYPCSENDNCEKKTKSELSENHNSQNQQQENEHCTPFCNCSHCPASVFYQNVFPYNFKEKTIKCESNKLITFYTFIYTQKIADKIWQPPKIS